MPLYEFRCPNGHDFEKFYRSIGTSQSTEKCPVCESVAERVMSAAGLVFKGSGFYITDYGKDGKKAERDAAKASSEKEATAANAATAESKPASGEASSKPAGDAAAPAVAPKPASESKPTAPAPTPAASPKPAPSKKTQ